MKNATPPNPQSSKTIDTELKKIIVAHFHLSKQNIEDIKQLFQAYYESRIDKAYNAGYDDCLKEHGYELKERH